MVEHGRRHFGVLRHFFFLLALVLVLSKILHDHVILAAVLPEVGMILLVGIIAGTLVTCIAKEPVNEGDERRCD
jgi:hypothetical protein